MWTIYWHFLSCMTEKFKYSTHWCSIVLIDSQISNVSSRWAPNNSTDEMGMHNVVNTKVIDPNLFYDIHTVLNRMCNSQWNQRHIIWQVPFLGWPAKGQFFVHVHPSSLCMSIESQKIWTMDILLFLDTHLVKLLKTQCPKARHCTVFSCSWVHWFVNILSRVDACSKELKTRIFSTFTCKKCTRVYEKPNQNWTVCQFSTKIGKPLGLEHVLKVFGWLLWKIVSPCCFSTCLLNSLRINTSTKC